MISPTQVRCVGRVDDPQPVTPNHGSWLNMAEMEFSTLATECLDQRIPDAVVLRTEVVAWEHTRNKNESTIN